MLIDAESVRDFTALMLIDGSSMRDFTVLMLIDDKSVNSFQEQKRFPSPEIPALKDALKDVLKDVAPLSQFPERRKDVEE